MTTTCRLEIVAPTPTELADQLAHRLNLAAGEVTIELVYRNQRLARIHIHEHRTLTRNDTPPRPTTSTTLPASSNGDRTVGGAHPEQQPLTGRRTP